jgi:hypothetical protein
MTDVDVMFTNQRVFKGDRVRTEVFSWMRDNCGGWHAWGMVDRDPDDGFAGETFQFRKPAHALMFKLRWGGK